MKISTKGRYALRMMIDLARNDQGGYIALRDVSGREEISPKYLEQIVTTLSRAGFLKSVRGAQGGYRLAREPKDYTVGEILRATEGNLFPVSCLENEPAGCDRVEQCATFSFWVGLQEVIDDYVDHVTLADLAARSGPPASCNP